MSNQKKDLTSIDDLGEFVHDLSEELSDNEETDFSEDLNSTDGNADFESAFSTEESEDFESSFPEDDVSAEFTSKFELPSQDDDESPVDVNKDEDEDYLENHTFSSSEEIEETRSPYYEETKTAIPQSYLEQAPQLPPETKSPENFSDLKSYAEASSFSQTSTEANPSFSVLLKDVRFIEDVNDILIILKDLKLMIDTEEVMKARLMRGSLLIPRISEYAAVFLAHKLRRFDVDIQLGLSDDIHPPKHQEKPETGVVSKANLHQNQLHNFQFDNAKIDISQIIVAASSILEGYQVIRYLGVASEHKFLSSKIVENESSDEIPQYYQELSHKLKAHAMKAHANAVVGLNYQLTPIPSEFGGSGHKYRLTCTGNLVWVNKL